jgi:uncharacterized membrane protein
MNSKFIYISLLIFISALSRLLPHPPDFTPLIAISIFAGATLFSKKESILIPIIAMFISDIFIGFHSLIPVVYGTMALISIISFYTLKQRSILKITAVGLGSGILFFLTTNLAVFLTSGMYEKSVQGFIECFTLAIPFFRNSLAGIAVYASLLFSILYLIETFVLNKKELKSISIKS